MSAASDAGYAALQNGDLGGAIAQLEQAHAADPSDFQACLYLGAAYGQAERHTDAVTVLTRAVQLQPANSQARYNLAVALESAGYNEQALMASRQAVQLQPDYPKAREMVARLSGEPVVPPAYHPTAVPPYGQAQPLPPYGQPMLYGQPPLPYSPPPNAYGQAPPSPYGQPIPPPMPYGTAPYPAQGAAAYGGAPLGTPSQAYYSAPMFQTEAPDASTALVLSILGIGLCWFLSPFGLLYALKARKQIEQNPNLTGGGKVLTALIISSIGSVLAMLAVIFFMINLMTPSGPTP